MEDEEIKKEDKIETKDETEFNKSKIIEESSTMLNKNQIKEELTSNEKIDRLYEHFILKKELKIKQDKQLFDKKNIININNVTFLVIFAIVFIVIGFGVNTVFISLTSNKNLDKFISQYYYILNNYYQELDGEELINNAIEGMLNSLDTYSNLITDDNLNYQLTGYYTGLGIEVYNYESNIIIAKVHEESPAYKAGLKVNDIITSYNGYSLENVSTEDFTTIISQSNTLKLEVKREEEIIEINVEKGLVTIKSVTYELLPNQIGYMKINIFANNTSEQVQQALNSLEEAGMEKLIIDVRNNSGGYLTTTQDIVSQFLDNSKITYQTQLKDQKEIFYSTGDKNKTYPIVILQNSNSASGSEMLIAALNENLDAYLIGETTFGKGTVQSIQTDADFSYKLTTKIWLTPNGIWVNEKGITPNQNISLSSDYYENPITENDNQLNAAINYLKDK